LLLRRKSQKKLDRLELPAEAYASILFDEAELEFAESEIIRLQSVLKIKESDREDASRKEASAGTALANALEEVKRLGAESPLAAQEIKGYFAARRKQNRQQINELEAAINSIYRELSRYIRVRENIDTNG